MADGFLLAGVFASAYLGFALLALSQARHWRAVAGGAPLSRRVMLGLRVVGPVGLALSLALAFIRDGASFGSLLWATAISVAALAVAFTLALVPGRKRRAVR